MSFLFVFLLLMRYGKTMCDYIGFRKDINFMRGGKQRSNCAFLFLEYNTLSSKSSSFEKTIVLCCFLDYVDFLVLNLPNIRTSSPFYYYLLTTSKKYADFTYW